MLIEERLNWSNFKQGSEEDFALLYRKYAPVMLRYGSKITSDSELIKDSLQQVFFNIWRSKENIGNPASVKNYLLKALRCELIKKLNHHESAHTTLPDNYHFEAEEPYETALIQLQTAEVTQNKIAALLEKLPARQREIIFLRYYANLKYDEISAVMDIEQESVYKLTYKAINKMQALLRDTALLFFVSLLF
jgi:RNA polymerase sigma factor (sigma-70 family)